MISKEHIGRIVSRHTAQVETGRLRFFAKAIGETNPLYHDEAAAKDRGYPGLLVPPTFLFCLDMDQDPYAWFPEVGLNLPQVLHGEQSFRYFRQSFAGDALTFESRIDDIYGKKNGALEFVVKSTSVHNQAGEHVAQLRGVIVHRSL